MLGEEETVLNITKFFMEAGFDPSKDMMQGYQLIQGRGLPQWRSVDAGRNRGGLVIDWNLKSALTACTPQDRRFFPLVTIASPPLPVDMPGRKAADYARQIGEPAISKEQGKSQNLRPIQK